MLGGVGEYLIKPKVFHTSQLQLQYLSISNLLERWVYPEDVFQRTLTGEGFASKIIYDFDKYYYHKHDYHTIIQATGAYAHNFPSTKPISGLRKLVT
jgi:hypothetical protein